MKLSIFIPTHKRKEKFERVFQRVKKLASKDIEIVVSCSSPEYIPNNESNIHCYDTKGYSREDNYMFGLSKCSGEYVVIVEDDDIINNSILENFVKSDICYDITVYGIIGEEVYPRKYGVFSGERFISEFYYIFGNSFQWGQCITRTRILRKNCSFLWNTCYERNLVQSDEIITLLSAKEANEVFISNEKILWIGKGNDNYSWGSNLENEQRERFFRLKNTYQII